MKTPHVVFLTFFLAVAALTGGCANTNSQPVSSSSYYGVAYGVIDSIELTSMSNDGIGGSGIGTGAVIGGIVGGVIGHQVGGGTGQDIATVAGVVGGAMVGNQIEKSRKQQDAYRIRVRLDNGGYQTVTQQRTSDLRVGDRVRIENNNVTRY